MRRYYNGIVLLFLFMILVSCSTTRNVDIQTMEPAQVSLSSTIKRVGIIGGRVHLKEEKEQTGLNVLISRENEKLAIKARDAAINGLYNALAGDTRFDTIILMEDIVENKEDPNTYGNYLDWNTVESLCNNYDVDAIFSMAYYDSDTRVSLKKTTMEQLNLLRVKEKVAAQQITLETLIENGWRIYDPSSKLLIDEFTFNNQIVSTAKGLDPYEALQAIEDRAESIVEKSKQTGSSYGARLQPYEHSITRDYYVRGTTGFEQAEIYTLSGDWEAAADLWKKETENIDPKISSKACYNLAVLNEINNNLDVAMDWATRAYSQYQTKKIAEYIESLKYRQQQNGLLLLQQSESLTSK
ncbi:MAG: DUF6340 family protein [Eudoraea sp.]|uniref:DUF6340 family protein n=1 Tax=Eudoraea sp. TaxID=1979955 RepID=UPI003C763635